MGGHTSKQTVAVSTRVAASIVQNTAQSCISIAYGGNTVAINGDYNSVQGVDQQVSVAVNSDCSTFAAQNSTFAADLADSLTQVLADQEVALTQWMDDSTDDQDSSIRQSVTASFTQDTVQNCINNLTGINNLYVSGDGNIVRGVTQGATLNVISQCLLQGRLTSAVVSDITNTVNQHGTYASQNPLAFITDAVQSLVRSAILAAAAVFIVVICFVLLFVAVRRRRRAPPPVFFAAPGAGATPGAFAAPGAGAAPGF